MNVLRAFRALMALVVLALVLVPAASAQDRGMRGDPAQMKDRLTTQVDESITTLALEGEKADTVRAILMARVDKRIEMISAMTGGGGGGMQGMRDQIAKLNEETSAQLTGVLSADELEAWKKLEEANNARGPRGGARGAGRNGG